MKRFCRSPEDFEQAAMDWMRVWGFSRVRRTPPGPDGGIDVESDEAVAQVKAYMVPVGLADVQRLRGTTYDGRIPIFFSLTGYTDAARTFANKADVALIRFSGYTGEIEPVNDAAQRLLEHRDQATESGREGDGDFLEYVQEGLSGQDLLESIAGILLKYLTPLEGTPGFANFLPVAHDTYASASSTGGGDPEWHLIAGSGPDKPFKESDHNEFTSLGWPLEGGCKARFMLERGRATASDVAIHLAKTLSGPLGIASGDKIRVELEFE